MSGLLQQPISHHEHDTHPSRRRWDLYCLGELASKELTQLTKHLEQCPRCQSQISRIRAEQSDFSRDFSRASFLLKLEHLEEARSVGSSSLEQVQPHLVLSPPMPKSESTGFWEVTQRWLRGISWWMAPVGALGVFLLFWLPSKQVRKDLHIQGRKSPLAIDVWRVKGGKPVFEVFLRRGKLQRQALVGERFRAGDLLGFRYRSAGYAYLTVLLIDAKGEISWLYPDKAAPSIPIAAQGQLRGTAELDQALGKEQIFAFFASSPLSSSQIKHMLPSPPLGAQAQRGISLFVHRFVIQK